MYEPRTLTEGIERIRVALSHLDWTDQVYGRVAQQLRQTVGQERPLNLPMFHVGGGEYVDCRPNDQYKSVVFAVALDKESSDWSQVKGHTPGRLNRTRRRIALIGWINLDKFRDWDDGSGFTELIKVDLRNTLIGINGVASIGNYTDNPIDSVYSPFQITELDTKFDRWPFAVFRQELELFTVDTRSYQVVFPTPETPTEDADTQG